MASYRLKCIDAPLNEGATGSVTLSYDFEVEDDLKAVAVANEYFADELAAAPYAVLLRNPNSPVVASVRVWQAAF